MPHFNWEQYGIAGIVIGILFFIVIRILIWVMAFIKDMTKQHNEERITWLAALNALNQSISLHNQGSIEARETQKDAHNFQRLEHEKLLAHMDEVTKTLVRINGYK